MSAIPWKHDRPVRRRADARRRPDGHRRGEWFEPGEDLVGYINALRHKDQLPEIAP